jgi:alanine racemase
MSRPIVANIHLDALAHNLHIARGLTSARIMAVIKANGYGHGLLNVAEALKEAEGFALLDIQDAIKLRQAGYQQTILLLEGVFSEHDLAIVAEYDLSCVIHNDTQIGLLKAYPRRNALQVWLKINTGMNRLGFKPESVAAAMAQLRSQQAIRDVTLMTHFAHADEVRGVSAQLEVFHQIACDYRAPRSLANSAAVYRYPKTHGDWVRPGIMLYGASPFANQSADELRLRPAMTLTSQIIAIQALQSGDEVGYGGLFRADRSMRIGIVACGYADGYPRQAPNGTPILVEGQLTQILGRVSMDMMCVDLTPVVGAQIGSPVTLWGQGLAVERVSKAAGTISYELLSAITQRVRVAIS